MGCDEEIVKAVEALTHLSEEPYSEYVIRCADNPLAKLVKIADINHNASPERARLTPATEEKDLKRIRKYIYSMQFLTGKIDADAYRSYVPY